MLDEEINCEVKEEIKAGNYKGQIIDINVKRHGEYDYIEFNVSIDGELKENCFSVPKPDGTLSKGSKLAKILIGLDYNLETNEIITDKILNDAIIGKYISFTMAKKGQFTRVIIESIKSIEEDEEKKKE